MNSVVQPLEMKASLKKPFLRHRALWVGLIFIISLTFRYQDFFLFREFNADKAHQLHAAYELLQGNGVSLKSYDLNTFKADQRPLLAWPPGYSYLVAGTSKLTGLSIYRASWAVDVLSLAGLWCVLLWFTALLRFTVIQTAVLFLLVGFCRTPWVYLWSADTLGTVLFLFSAALNVYFIQRKTSNRINLAMFGSIQFLLFAAMCFLKYSLLPAYVSLGLSIFSFSWKAKQKNYTAGIILLIAACISFVLLQLYNLMLSGNTSDMGNLYQQQAGWFFSNLSMYSAFFLRSFIYIDGFLDKANSQSLMIIVQLLNGLIILAVLFHISKRVLSGKADYFSHLVLLATICICGFLTVLSVRYGQQMFVGTYRWTYVKEVRYFMPASFLLALYLIRNFHPRMPRSAFSFFSLSFIGSAAIFGLVLHSYYKVKKNRAGSFENLTGHIVRAEQFVKQREDSNTYFLSMTGNSGIDAEATSLAAIQGSKVVISYDGIFPTHLSPLFSNGKTFDHHKKVIIYLSKNLRIVDSLNPLLPHSLEKSEDGENFLLVDL